MWCLCKRGQGFTVARTGYGSVAKASQDLLAEQRLIGACSSTKRMRPRPCGICSSGLPGCSPPISTLWQIDSKGCALPDRAGHVLCRRGWPQCAGQWPGPFPCLAPAFGGKKRLKDVAQHLRGYAMARVTYCELQIITRAQVFLWVYIVTMVGSTMDLREYIPPGSTATAQHGMCSVGIEVHQDMVELGRISQDSARRGVDVQAYIDGHWERGTPYLKSVLQQQVQIVPAGVLLYVDG